VLLTLRELEGENLAVDLAWGVKMSGHRRNVRVVSLHSFRTSQKKY
jgi:hypothetical protein